MEILAGIILTLIFVGFCVLIGYAIYDEEKHKEERVAARKKWAIKRKQIEKMLTEAMIKEQTKKLAAYDEEQKNKEEKKEINICEELHKILWTGKRFDSNWRNQNLPKQGIYIMFEEGEEAFGGDRIVRIGSSGNLASRIEDHFDNPFSERDVLRRTIENCGLINLEATTYIRTHMTFVVLHVTNDDLKKRLIGTVSNCRDCQPSPDWLGLQSNNPKIKESGLWQDRNLYGVGLTKSDLELIKQSLV